MAPADGLGSRLHRSGQAAQAQPCCLPTSWGVCATQICPADLFWKALPVCFYPSWAVPARVQALGTLRQDSRDTEPQLQIPDGMCCLGLGYSEWAGALTYSAIPRPLFPKEWPTPGPGLWHAAKPASLVLSFSFQGLPT